MSAAGASNAGRLVIVDGVGAATHRWNDALREFHPEVVASLADASELTHLDVLIVDLPELNEPVLRSIRAAFDDAPGAKRLLAASHGELPSVLKACVHDRFRHIVPRDGKPSNVRKLVEALRDRPRDLLVGGPDDALESKCATPTTWWFALELLRWTIEEAIRVPGVIVRSYQPEGDRLEIQLVFRRDRAFERFHCDLPRRWRWPARSRADETFTRVDRADPSVQTFGEIAPDQEVYVCPVRDSVDRAYLAILPWTKDERITVALGVWIGEQHSDDAPPDALDERRRGMIDLHALATRDVPQFTLPTLSAAANGVRYLLEYKWVVSSGYAGPDRRKEDTSLVNRYMFRGRRKTIARSIRELGGGFVDGMPSWIGVYFALYSALAVIDTAFTSRFVSSGQVTELNPLLAPLIVDHPWLFLLAKNICALSAFFTIVRFHAFRGGRRALGVSLGLYALLDVYWAVLLLGTFRS